jgi:ASPIC/UnbV protein/VCBS repeat protein
MLVIVDRSSILQIPLDESWSSSEYRGQTFGMAVGDFDANGRLDLFLNHHIMNPSVLIRDFAFSSADAFDFNLDADEHGATFFDIDQDGDLDLLDTSGGRLGQADDPADPYTWSRVLLNQEGALDLDDAAGDLGLRYPLSRTRMLVPVNLDGELTLFNASLTRSDGTWPSTFFRMQEDGSFAEWELPGAPLGDSTIFGIGAHLGPGNKIDFVAYDGRDLLKIFQRSGASQTFVRQDIHTGSEGISDLAVADFDGDQRAEIFVGQTNSFSRLYERAAGGTWQEIGQAAHLRALKTGTAGATAGDFDNDGDIDIATVNSGPALSLTFWTNNGSGRFTRQNYNDPEVRGTGQNIVSGDFDNDGALDFLVATGNGSPTSEGAAGEYVYLDTKPTTNHWLSISLAGTHSETSGLGARVFVTTPDGKTRVLEQDSGAHTWVQDSPRLHFGLGPSTMANVRIVWPNRDEQTITNVAADRHVVITQSQPLAATAIAEHAGGGDGSGDDAFSFDQSRLADFSPPSDLDLWLA